MHRPPSSRRRSSYAPQLCAAGASLLLLLSLSILYMRLSSSPHHSSTPLFNSSAAAAYDASPDDRTDDLLLLDENPSPLTPPPDDTAQSLFWDHALGAARISFDRAATTRSPIPVDFVKLDLAFGSDDEPVDETVRAKLASVRRIEDVLLIGNSVMRDGWAKWLEGKGDFIKKDRMLRSNNHELLNPRNHLLLQDPDVAGFAGMTRGDRMMQRAVLREMEAADSSGLKVGMEGRRSLREKKDEGSGSGSGLLGVDLGLGFSEFVDQFFDGGLCSIRVFMVWNSPSWSFGVRHRRGVESLLYHHRNACVLLFSETVELDFFKEFVEDG